MEKNQIFKRYGTDYKEMTKRLLEDSDLIGLIPGKDCHIGIKPNLVSPSPASYGATTHTEVVAGIIEYLQERGCRNLTMMEGSWVGDRTTETVQVCGYDVLSKKYGVDFLDTQKEKGVKRNCQGMELSICRCVENVDFLINVPVLKGHCQTKITCALKNVKGLIPNSEKRRFHSLGLHKPIAHLNAGIHQDFIVVDHICGDLDFEDGGNPVVRNCVMTARDPVLVDAYVCHLLHYRTEEVPYVTLAEKLGVGCGDLSKADIRVWGKSFERKKGTGAEIGEGFLDHEADRNFTAEEELPYANKVVAVRDQVEEVESCSACYGYLIPALDRLRQEGLLEKLDTKICIGQGYRGKSGKLGVGLCTAGFEHCVKGCPPTEGQIYEFLRDYIEEYCAHPSHKL